VAKTFHLVFLLAASKKRSIMCVHLFYFSPLSDTSHLNIAFIVRCTSCPPVSLASPLLFLFHGRSHRDYFKCWLERAIRTSYRLLHGPMHWFHHLLGFSFLCFMRCFHVALKYKDHDDHHLWIISTDTVTFVIRPHSPVDQRVHSRDYCWKVRGR
jgi:hypothetical protein